MEKKERKISGKKRKEKSLSGADVDKVGLLGSPDQKSIDRKEEKKKRKLSKKKRDKQNVNGAVVNDIDQPAFEVVDSSNKPKHGKSTEGKEEKKKKKLSKKKRGKQNANGADADEISQPGVELGRSSKKLRSETEIEVYQISSVDTDSSKGMKKWISEYYERRPGLNILQERIDEFITSHEEREEQAKAHAAEEGWTVVEHHKGRKKTTDAESGVAVGSVAQAAVLDKMGKKKVKDVGPDFYRFQKREAQRNEIMMLQSKFELDKKRIQQLRAARKFRPY